jgi:predicted PurR-regulated permease PerM
MIRLCKAMEQPLMKPSTGMKLDALSVSLAWILLMLNFKFNNVFTYFFIGIFTSMGINYLVKELYSIYRDRENKRQVSKLLTVEKRWSRYPEV